MDNRAIGVFDSGIGGLTAVKVLNEIMPEENIVYFGDTARVPYGTRSRETILKYTMQDIKFLLGHDVKMIIAACGTASTVLKNEIVRDFTYPFTSVLLPAAQAACAATKTGRIGVIATPATIKSGAYGKAIRNIRSDAVMVGNACPLFVPLVENGFVERDNKITIAVAKQYLEPFMHGETDTLILGCTHYPVIADIIGDILGDKVKLINTGAEAAKTALSLLTSHQLRTDHVGRGTNRYFVSDSAESFSENAKLYLGTDEHCEAHRVDIDCL